MMQDKRQLMQEALDGALTPEQAEELSVYLDENPREADHYDQLQRVDDMLRIAPHERAPQRLALTIMARLAQTVQQQAQLQHNEVSEAAVNVAVQMVTVATLPLMVGASYLILNAMADPEAMETVLAQVAAVLILVIDVLKVMLEEAQAVYAEDPETALALLSLIPGTLLVLLKQILVGEDEDEA